MTKMTKIMFVFGLIVAVTGVIIIFSKKNEIPPALEIAMKVAAYDKQSGKTLELQPNQSGISYGIVQFVTQPNSKNMSTALLCVQQSKLVDKVDLYMPDMGHGSQPPTIQSIEIPANIKTKAPNGNDLGCFKVENMQLFMTGPWQMRVFYQNGILGYFDISIAE